MATRFSGTTLLAQPAAAHRRPSVVRDRSAGLSVQAVARDSRESLKSRRPQGATAERVLRYPGGRERRIRYPAPDDSYDSDDGFLGDDYYWGGPNELAWGVGLTSSNNIVPHKKIAPKSRAKPKESAPKPRTEPRAAARPKMEAPSETEAAKRFFDAMWDLPAAEPAKPEKVDTIPSSAGDFLRQVTSDDYKQAQEELNAKIRGSYDVLTECPWILPRKVFCIAADALETENPKSYTLRTRMDIEGAADELSKVFRKTKPGIGKKFQFNKIVDGLLVFEDVEDAGRFQEHLEADGYLQVQLAEVDSHEMFRQVQHVKGAVVLLRSGGYIPLPSELKPCLLEKNPMEDDH